MSMCYHPVNDLKNAFFAALDVSISKGSNPFLESCVFIQAPPDEIQRGLFICGLLRAQCCDHQDELFGSFELERPLAKIAA